MDLDTPWARKTHGNLEGFDSWPPKNQGYLPYITSKHVGTLGGPRHINLPVSVGGQGKHVFCWQSPPRKTDSSLVNWLFTRILLSQPNSEIPKSFSCLWNWWPLSQGTCIRNSPNHHGFQWRPGRAKCHVFHIFQFRSQLRIKNGLAWKLLIKNDPYRETQHEK